MIRDSWGVQEGFWMSTVNTERHPRAASPPPAPAGLPGHKSWDLGIPEQPCPAVGWDQCQTQGSQGGHCSGTNSAKSVPGTPELPLDLPAVPALGTGTAAPGNLPGVTDPCFSLLPELPLCGFPHPGTWQDLHFCLPGNVAVITVKPLPISHHLHCLSSWVLPPWDILLLRGGFPAGSASGGCGCRVWTPAGGTARGQGHQKLTHFLAC